LTLDIWFLSSMTVLGFIGATHTFSSWRVGNLNCSKIYIIYHIIILSLILLHTLYEKFSSII
jgi:hypothetical protein